MNEKYRICKYCTEKLEDCIDEGLDCKKCAQSVHSRCLKTSIPGGLNGDVFFTYTCQECSHINEEIFVRNKLSWLKVLILILYHLQTRSPGLAKKGFFHWRNHVVALINKNWNVLFMKDFKQKKKWIGTVAGTLSNFAPYYFKSGLSVLNEPAWWALTYPKLTPFVISNIYNDYNNEKLRMKLMKIIVNKTELFEEILHKHVKNKDFLTSCATIEVINIEAASTEKQEVAGDSVMIKKGKKRKNLLPTFERTSKKLLKLNQESGMFPSLDEVTATSSVKTNGEELPLPIKTEQTKEKEPIKLLDPLCHYNTALNSICLEKGAHMKLRLMGGIRKELILSPYSSIYLKPYIRRDTETYPSWLQLMTEMQLKANKNQEKYVLPPRASIDYTYVQPEHIPAINSLCNHYFWPGIDMSECLEYPDFSCVVMYKKLIVAFAFIVPNVNFTENYVSFIFTRPGWRKVGIGKFMLYHLIQTSLGKDITLHVSINNPALFLYQKFGFKVEGVILGFYDKYIRSDRHESKHAFFCRLER